MDFEKKPSGYDDYLSDYQIVLHDACCGEPIAWGFRIIRYLGEELYRNIDKKIITHCIDHGEWVLITKLLTREEAEKKYGKKKDDIFGPKGGWISVTFGEKEFCSKYLKPLKEDQDQML